MQQGAIMNMAGSIKYSIEYRIKGIMDHIDFRDHALILAAPLFFGKP